MSSYIRQNNVHGMSLNYLPPIRLRGQELHKVERFKYLGHIITCDLKDDCDIERERRALALRENMLARRMYPSRRANDSVHWFMGELTSRVVAGSGIPSDRYHLGKILLQSLKDDLDFVLQVDGGIGKSVTNGSVLERTVRCATALRNLGLLRGDVIVLMAPNHLDLAIPFYAALYLGVAVCAIDRTFGVNELRGTFEQSRPRVIFCQSNRAADVQRALNENKSDAIIVSFDKSDVCSFSEFLEKYADDSPTDEFNPTDFDPEDTIALLISTSGTTGLPKMAAATHKNFAITGPYSWNRYTKYPKPFKMMLVLSPLQWLTAIAAFLMSPILRFTRLQTSEVLTQDHVYHLINAYKPTYMIASPTYLTTLITPEGPQKCDLSCFEFIFVGGSAVSADLLQEIKKISPKTEVLNVYGLTESTTFVFRDDGATTSSGAVGKPFGLFQYRLIDLQTQEDISEPNRNGELWIKGPGIVKGYYSNPEATAEAFTEDQWFKTGDMFYRDENYNFFFVERIKMLIKYMSYQISPVEIEAIIRQHPEVLDVAVTSIPDPKCGDLPVACVVRRPGRDVSDEEIKRLVKDNLAESKQLRGGVIFMDTLPLTATTKIHRRKLKEIAMQKLGCKL